MTIVIYSKPNCGYCISAKNMCESKGINYGYIEVHPNGFVDRSNVDGIDSDLVLRPFIQKGVIGTLRDFSNMIIALSVSPISFKIVLIFFFSFHVFKFLLISLNSNLKCF